MATQDIFNPLRSTDCAGDAAAVTPGDTSASDFSLMARALFVGGAGNVSLVTKAGNAVLLTGVLAGSILPIQCRRVNNTNTTATNIVALF